MDGTKHGPVAWSENDALFRKLLFMGWEWEKVVAERLRQYGVDAQAKTHPNFRETIADAGAWAREPDVLVRIPGVKRSLEVEVKSQAHAFGDSPANWPQNRSTVLIETTRSMDGRGSAPEAYALISRKTRGIVALSPESMEEWYIHPTYDKVRGIKEEWWACETHLLQPFKWLVAYLGGSRAD